MVSVTHADMIDDFRTRGSGTRGVVLFLSLHLVLLTGCGSFLATMTGMEETPAVEPLLVPGGRDGEGPVISVEAEYVEDEFILSLPDELFASASSGGGDAEPDIPEPDGRHLPLVLFPFDSWVLTSQAKTILKEAGTWLRTYNHGELSVEGHTDPKGTTSYNHALGLRRAESVRRYLVSLGVRKDTMVPTSFGKEAPVCRQATAYCDAMNRRSTVFVAQRHGHPVVSALTNFTEHGQASPPRPTSSPLVAKEFHP